MGFLSHCTARKRAEKFILLEYLVVTKTNRAGFLLYLTKFAVISVTI